MAEFFTDIFDWMLMLSPVWAYTAILVIAYGENVVPPIPGDMVVVFGGYLVGLGRLNFAAVVVLATVGGALGFMTMYALGYRIGEAMLDPKRFRWIPKKQVHKAREKIARWGYGVVAANRFLSGLRSVISITVGMAHMDPWKTTVYATLSAAVWTGLITYLGYLLGENWEAVSGYLQTYGWFIGGAIVLFAVIQIVRAYRRRKREGEAAVSAKEEVESAES